MKKDEIEWAFAESSSPLGEYTRLFIRRVYRHSRSFCYSVEVVDGRGLWHASFRLPDKDRFNTIIPAKRWHRDKEALADIVRIKYNVEVMIEN